MEANSGGLVGLTQRSARGGVHDAMVSPVGVKARATDLRDRALAEAGSICIGLET